MSSANEVTEVARHFAVGGDCVEVTPHGSGHIHDSFRVSFRQRGGVARGLLQRINGAVFGDPVALMQNIGRASAHLHQKLEGESDRERRCLTVIPTRTGEGIHRSEAGECWRMYRFIERARSYDAVQCPAQAREAAKAFGRFQALLADLPGERLHETIPDFHHTPKRLAALERAVASDSSNRAGVVRREIDFAMRRRDIAGLLLQANLPERVTHNDTKLNNVLMDEESGEGICVIDLDTVMPGLAPYDFGDLVRTTTSPTLEDERDLSKVGLQWGMFDALLRGYLDGAGRILTEAERRHLVCAGKVITLEIGIRFLTDYLQGDIYYKTSRPHQNLDRCRTQFRLVESIEEQEDRMERLVSSLSAS